MLPFHLQISAAGVLAIAVSVYTFLQAAKKAGLDKFLSGRVAQAFSAALALGGTFFLAGNASPNTICMAIAAALAAAGIHAHVKTAVTGSLVSPTPPASASAAKAAALLLVLALPLVTVRCALATAPPNVPQPVVDLKLASGLVDSVAHGLLEGQTAVRTLHQAGEISQAEANSLNTRILAVAAKDEAARIAVEAADKNPGDGWKGALREVVAASATLTPSTFGISNPTAATAFATSMTLFETSVGAISAHF